MVEQQGEMLNNIEKNVDMSRDYVAEAETELVKAKEYVQTTRKVPLIFIIHGFVFDSFDIPCREGPSGLSYCSLHFEIIRLTPLNSLTVLVTLVRIFDFGLARDLNYEREHGSLGRAGTVQYMASEVIKKRKSRMPYGLKADIYS